MKIGKHVSKESEEKRRPIIIIIQVLALIPAFLALGAVIANQLDPIHRYKRLILLLEQREAIQNKGLPETKSRMVEILDHGIRLTEQGIERNVSVTEFMRGQPTTLFRPGVGIYIFACALLVIMVDENISMLDLFLRNLILSIGICILLYQLYLLIKIYKLTSWSKLKPKEQDPAEAPQEVSSNSKAITAWLKKIIKHVFPCLSNRKAEPKQETYNEEPSDQVDQDEKPADSKNKEDKDKNSADTTEK